MNAKGKKRRDKANRMQRMRFGFAHQLIRLGVPTEIADQEATSRRARDGFMGTGAHLRVERGARARDDAQLAARELIRRVPDKPRGP